MRFRTGFFIKTVLMCLLLTSCGVQEDPIDSLFDRIHQANNAFSEESETLNSQTAQNSEDEPLNGVWISYLELSKLAGSAESVFHAQAAAMMQRVKESGGNAVFVLICHWAWHRGLMLAPLAKTICMFTSSLVLLKVLALPEKMVFAIGFMMGWPQMVTGICGILLARLITKRTATF